MAIDKETNKTAGGGGGIDIESTDQSITITETEPGKKDLSVNWGDMPATVITSPDNSVEVTETDKNTFELSVPLATEERNGLLSAVGKYQNDHAQLIETETQSETANNAAGKLMGEDLEFVPVEGQMMTWTDTNGKLHLSRYEPNLAKNNGFGEYNWRTAAYDATTGAIIVESKSGGNSNPAYGKFKVTRSENGGWTWTEYNDPNSPNENWGCGAANNGTTVFISRNKSQEIEWTTDGGITWTRSNLPIDTKWTSVWWDENDRWCFRSENNEVFSTTDFSNFRDDSANYPAGCYCYFLPKNPSRYNYAQKTSDWVCLCRKQVFGMTQNVLMLKTNNGWVNWWSFGVGSLLSRHYDITIQAEAADGTISDVDCDLFVNDEGFNDTIAIWIDNDRNKNVLCTGSPWWAYPARYSLKEGKLYGFIAKEDKIYKAVGSFGGSGGVILETTEVIWENTQPVNMLAFEGNKILTFGGCKHDDSGYRMSDFYVMLTVVGLDLMGNPPDFWREIPLLDENQNGILRQKGNTVETVSLGEFLQEDNSGGSPQLKTVHSDRITMYANYMLQNSNGVCWCPVDVADMVDGTTKIYADEDCTDEIGIVTNHSYNPGNPYDVEVSIDGNTEVYVLDPTKIPQSLATTAAIIEALKKKGDVATSVYFKANGTGPWVAVAKTWNTDHYEATPATNPGFIVVLTTDGQEPAADLSNVAAYYQWTAGSTFGIVAISPFYDESNGEAPIYINL